MNVRPVLAALIAGVCLLAAGSARAAEPAAAPSELQVSVEVSAFDKYVSRGCNLSDDPVLQPMVSATWKGLKAWAWGNMELADESDNADSFTELDFGLEYSRTLGIVKLAGGVIHYRYPNTDTEKTTELYASLGLDVPLNPTVTIFRDVDSIDGTYSTFALKHVVEGLWKPSDKASVDLELGASVGYGSAANNAACFGDDNDGFADATFSAKLPVKLGTKWVVAPSAWYSTVLDSTARRASAKDDNFYTGLTVTFTF